jgi:hypothetical protein
LSTTDLGKILAVIKGRMKTVNLYHDPSKGNYKLAQDTKNTTLAISKGELYGFYLKVSQQSSTGQVVGINLPLSDDEAVVLEIGLEKAVERIIGW